MSNGMTIIDMNRVVTGLTAGEFRELVIDAFKTALREIETEKAQKELERTLEKAKQKHQLHG
jgi:hypothetical protein